MASVEPFDILAQFPGTSTRFELTYVQEASSTRGGRASTRDLGPPLWEADYQTRELAPLQLRRWKAVLARLNGGTDRFVAYDLTAGFPIAYPRGSWGGTFNGSCVLSSVASNNLDVVLTGLPSGFKFRVGDYISFPYGSAGARALHQVETDAAANSSGVVALEVRPHVRVGWSGGATVALVRPFTYMTVVPGTLKADASLSGRGAITFTGRQSF